MDVFNIVLFLKSFSGKDQGQNVREKAKQLVNLLKDDDRLKNERARALKAKERFAQSTCGFGSDGGLDTPSSPKYPAFRGDWGSRDSGKIKHFLMVQLWKWHLQMILIYFYLFHTSTYVN